MSKKYNTIEVLGWKLSYNGDFVFLSQGSRQLVFNCNEVEILRDGLKEIVIRRNNDISSSELL